MSERITQLDKENAAALLQRLAELPTETPPLSAAEQEALYRRALQKLQAMDGSAASEEADAARDPQAMGESAAAAQAASGESAHPCPPTGEQKTPPPTADAPAAAQAAPRARRIRWQRWALSAAAALAVVALSGVALVTGGLRMGASDEAAPQSPEVPMETATTEDTAEYSVADESFADSSAAITGSGQEPGATAPDAEEKPFFGNSGLTDGTTDGSAETGKADAPDTPAESAPPPDSALQDGFANGHRDPTPDSGPIGQPDDGASAPPAAPQTVADALVIMVDGHLYFSMGGALAAEPSRQELLGEITSTVPAGTLPRQDGQANFLCSGAPYARFESGMALLLNDEWIYFAPVG